MIIEILKDCLSKFDSAIVVNDSAATVWIVDSVLVPSASVLVDVVIRVIWDRAVGIESVVIDLCDLALLNAFASNHWVVVHATRAVCFPSYVFGVVEASTGIFIKVVQGTACELVEGIACKLAVNVSCVDDSLINVVLKLETVKDGQEGGSHNSKVCSHR